MNLKVFSIYDAKAKAFQSPFYMVTLGQALRAFDDLVNEKDSFVNKHPEDYQLYQVAEYDDSNATFQNRVPLNMIATAVEYLKTGIKPADIIKELGVVTPEKVKGATK